MSQTLRSWLNAFAAASRRASSTACSSRSPSRATTLAATPATTCPRATRPATCWSRRSHAPAADRPAQPPNRPNRRPARVRGRRLRRPATAGPRPSPRLPPGSASRGLASRASTCLTPSGKSLPGPSPPSYRPWSPSTSSSTTCRVIKDARGIGPSSQDAKSTCSIAVWLTSSCRLELRPHRNDRSPTWSELYLIEHADGPSFPSIVASGPNASIPHAAARADRRIRGWRSPEDRHWGARTRLRVGHDPHRLPRASHAIRACRRCTPSCWKRQTRAPNAHLRPGMDPAARATRWRASVIVAARRLWRGRSFTAWATALVWRSTSGRRYRSHAATKSSNPAWSSRSSRASTCRAGAACASRTWSSSKTMAPGPSATRPQRPRHRLSRHSASTHRSPED